MKKHSVILGVFSLLIAGCATTPPYPAVESGAPACVLRLENQMSTFEMLAQFEIPTPAWVAVKVDGFLPATTDHLVRGSYLPKGTIELRLPAGDHELVNEAELIGRGIYYFKPVAFRFGTVTGKTYTIRFKGAGSAMKPGYTIEYEGWSDEEKAQWPHEHYIANPLVR